MEAPSECLINEAHSSSILCAMRDLFNSNSLVDCVLVAEGHCLKAHKAILAGSSSYFQMIFTQDIDKFPIVFLKDFKYQYLKLVIDYIYQGQIKIKPYQFNMFLEVAQSLKIRGLETMRRENVLDRCTSFNLPENQSVKAANTSLNSVTPDVKMETEDVSDSRIGDDVTEMNNVIEDLDIPTQQIEYCSESVEESATSVVHSQHNLFPSANAVLEIGVTKDTESQQSTSFNAGVSSTIDCSAGHQMENYSKVFEGADIKSEEAIVTENSLEDSQYDLIPSANAFPERGVTRDTESQQRSLYSGVASSINDCSSGVAMVNYSLLYNEPDIVKEETSVSDNLLENKNDHTESVVKACCNDETSRNDPSYILPGEYQEDDPVERQSPLEGAAELSPPSSARLLTWPVCNNSFPFKSLLSGRKRSHTGEAPHECSVCLQKFSYRGDLNKHFRIHTGEKPCVCSICGKRFARKDNFNEHMRRHKCEKPYPCSMCTLKFCAKSNLTNHMRVHTGEKFVCSICNKQLARKVSFKKHMRRHMEKP